MSLENAVLTYKNTENIYAEGIETPHGRIKIVFDVIETNIDIMLKKHPKTDFGLWKSFAGSFDLIRFFRFRKRWKACR